MTRTVSETVETAILHNKMIRDGCVVRAEQQQFSPDNGWSVLPQVDIHEPLAIPAFIPRYDPPVLWYENVDLAEGLPEEEIPT